MRPRLFDRLYQYKMHRAPGKDFVQHDAQIIDVTAGDAEAEACALGRDRIDSVHCECLS